MHSAEWKWSAPLHYVNPKVGTCTVIMERDCSDDFCVVGAIGNYTSQLKDSLRLLKRAAASASRVGASRHVRMPVPIHGDVRAEDDAQGEGDVRAAGKGPHAVAGSFADTHPEVRPGRVPCVPSEMRLTMKLRRPWPRFGTRWRSRRTLPATSTSRCTATTAIWAATRKVRPWTHIAFGFERSDSLRSAFSPPVAPHLHFDNLFPFAAAECASLTSPCPPDVSFYNYSTNLHHVWDTSMIYRKEDELGGMWALYEDLQHELATTYAPYIEEWRSCPGSSGEAGGDEAVCPLTWAVESAGLACTDAWKGIYKDIDLGDAYYNPNIKVSFPRAARASFAFPDPMRMSVFFPKFAWGEKKVPMLTDRCRTFPRPARPQVVYERLAMGGVRLAHMLNSIFT